MLLTITTSPSADVSKRILEPADPNKIQFKLVENNKKFSLVYVSTNSPPLSS